jgi:VanZ family protein
MEFVQENWIPNRSFDLLDILADTIGSIVGVFIIIQLNKKVRNNY